jgi:hypothetical protein
VADLPPDVIERAERQVNAVFAKIIGGVMLWIGVAFVALFVWASYKILLLRRPPEFGMVALLGALAVLAAFCSLVGWRLFLNRPNRFGSILTPLGWRILGAMFGVFTIGFLLFWIMLIRDGASTDLMVIAVISIASSALFCHWCLSAARQGQANAGRSSGAL